MPYSRCGLGCWDIMLVQSKEKGTKNFDGITYTPMKNGNLLTACQLSMYNCQNSDNFKSFCNKTDDKLFNFITNSRTLTLKFKFSDVSN